MQHDVVAFEHMALMIKWSRGFFKLLLMAQIKIGYTRYLSPCIAWSANVCFLAFFDLLITPFQHAAL